MAITQGGAIAYGNNVVTGGGSGGGSGHDILNDAGSTLPKEGKLQFVGVYVHDDSINGKTVVENYREMTAAEYAQLTAEQKKGLINVTDEQGHPITASATGFDNTGTSFEGDNVQEVLEEIDDKFDDLTNNIEFLADCTQTDTEYSLPKDLSNYKYLMATSYYNQYSLTTTIMALSNITYNNTFIICSYYDGTLRKGQIGIKSSSKIFTTPTSWVDITGIKVYGIK